MQVIDAIHTAVDPGPVPVAPQSAISYWRPGGKNMGERYFYNGIVLDAWRVNLADGSHKEVVGVN